MHIVLNRLGKKMLAADPEFRRKVRTLEESTLPHYWEMADDLGIMGEIERIDTSISPGDAKEIGTAITGASPK